VAQYTAPNEHEKEHKKE
jgi:hypothetical protein